MYKYQAVNRKAQNSVDDFFAWCRQCAPADPSPIGDRGELPARALTAPQPSHCFYWSIDLIYSQRYEKGLVS